jgi:hypothetical protein
MRPESISETAAKGAASDAMASMRVNAQAAVHNSLMRQAAEYQRLARELASAVGHMQASAALLNDRAMSTAVDAYFLPALSVPAPPQKLISRHRDVEFPGIDGRRRPFSRSRACSGRSRPAGRAATGRERPASATPDAALTSQQVDNQEGRP